MFNLQLVMDKTTSLRKNKGNRIYFVFLLYCLCFGIHCFSQSIVVTNISPNPACSGQSVTVTFTATNGNGNPNHYTSSSVFSVYLSSAGGGTPYTLIGNLTINPYGFLPNNGDQNPGIQGTVTLPSNLTGVYKIAVGSTSPIFNAGGGAGASLNFNINTAPTGGAVTGGATVCAGSNSTLLTLSGNTGTIDKWQSSTVSDFSSNVTDIVNTASTYTVNNITATTYYRAVVTNGTCPSYSSVATLQVASGNVSANQNICFNTQPAGISLSGYQGTIIKWQKSTDNSTYDDFVVTSSATLTSAQLGALAETNYYRAVLDDGGSPCGLTISNVITITVSTTSIGGSISPSEVLPAVCPSATTVLTLSGYTGNIIKWQSSPNQNFNTDVVDIFNYTNTLSVTNLSATTYYRALVTNGGCAGATSTKAKINAITGGPTGGMLSPSNTSLCSATNSTVLTLSGSTGTIQKWQYSSVSDFSSGVTDIANTTSSLTVTNLAVTRYYRVVLLKNSCTAYSSIATITVYPSLTAAISGNNGPLCSGSNAVFNLTGTNGAIVTYNINGGANQAVALSGAGLATVTITGVTVNQTLNLVSINSGSCSTTISGTSTVVVNPNPTASISGNNSPLCSGSNSVFNLSGTNNAVVTYTINGGGNQTVTLSGTGTATVTLTGVTSNQTLNLVSVSLGGCNVTLSGNSTVILNSTTTWTGAAADNQWGTPGNWSCNALPAASSDVIINSGTVIVSGINGLANTVTLNGTATLTVNSGNTITVTNAINTASGAVFTLQNNANLLQVNNVSNSGNLVVNRESSALKRLDYTLWSSPVAGQNLKLFSPFTAYPGYPVGSTVWRFYTYNSATNAYNSIDATANNFQTGKGYLIRIPDNHPATPTIWNGKFTGVPNNGTITLNSLYSGANGFRFNAVGNPYPSPVNMVSFINGNSSNITGTLYFWRKSNSTTTDPGYCTWTTAGGVATFHDNGEDQVVDPNGILRTGQGFIVEMLPGATSLVFTNLMRSSDTANQFFRSSAETGPANGDRIWLNLTKSGGGFSQMLVGYFPNATLGVDYGIDGSVLGNPRPLLCSLIDNVDYVIQGRPPFVDTDVVPLNFRASQPGQYTIAVDHVDGLFLGDQGIYLKDRLINTIHNLKAGAYVFASEAGDFPNRFEIVYQTLLSANHSNFNENTVIVFKDKNGDLKVNANGVALDKVEVFDVGGRMLVQKDAKSNSTVFISEIREENTVLFVKVVASDGGTVNKKIVF